MIENGMLDYKEPEYRPCTCPVCSEECESIYKDRWGNICGCENCVDRHDAWEVLNDE